MCVYFFLLCCRSVVASLIGHSDRCDWRACSLSSDEESALVEQLKIGLRPFDFANEE